MDFIINAVLHMFDSLHNYIIASYILIIPLIVILGIMLETSDNSDLLTSDETCGMILLAPLSILFVFIVDAISLFLLLLYLLLPIGYYVCASLKKCYNNFKRYKKVIDDLR